MKKLLLIIALLICQVAIGQKNVSVISPTRYSGEGTPYFKKNVPARALYINYLNDSVYQFARWNDLNGRWNLCTDIKAINDIRGGTAVKGEKGDKGDPGVCPDCPPSGGGGFPYIIVSGSGNSTTDQTNVTNAVTLNRTTNKPIYIVGNITTGQITVAKDNYRLTIIGYGSKWNILSSASSGLKRITPLDNSDANVFIVARHVIEGIEFVGTGSQVAVDLGPSYMSVYRDLKFDSFKEALHLRFALRTSVINCEAVNCVNGFFADIGNWTGANNFNSQSNHTTFESCRVYMPSNGLIGFAIYAASGCVVRDCIIEGHVVSRGIDFDGMGSSVVKDFTVENVHFECVNGSTDCFIRVRILGGTVTINKAFGQYGSIFLDANSGSGLGFVTISNVPWWVGRSGKMFRSSNIAMHFDRNEAFRGISSSMWEGTAPTSCMPIGSTGCGYNKYTYIDIPR